MKLIYLDHNATTPLAAEATEAMLPWLGARFGNPTSQHQFGRRARQALEDAREAVGRMLGATVGGQGADRVGFTSGGTEANNLALLGLAGIHEPSHPPGEAIVSVIEHASVSGPAELLKRHGWTIHWLGVDSNGLVDLHQLDALLHERIRFVSVMLANNETGVLEPIAEIAAHCARLGVPLHTDAAQAVGKVPVDFRALGASALSIAAHKFHGPLGIGALIVKHGTRLAPTMVGGFQQEGLRPGTESVALAVGLSAALAAAEREGPTRTERMQSLRDRLEAGLGRELPGRIAINSGAVPRAPHTSNMAFLGHDRQALLMALDLAGVACSTGSACASGSSEPSKVLAAMGASGAVLGGSLRFSLGATTTPEEIDEAIERIAKVCRQSEAFMTRPAVNER